MNHEFPLLHLDDLAFLIMETAPIGILVVNSDGQIVMLSSQAEAWFGYSSEELLGKKVETIVPQASQSAHVKYRSEYISRPTGRPVHAGQHFSGRHKNGTEFPVDISLSPLITGSGTFILANIQTAAERGPAGAQRKQLQKERLAAIGETVAGLAHESRNALQRAGASLDLLELDCEAGSDSAALVGKIREALSDLRRNYEDVKNYAAPIMLNYRKANLLELFEEAFHDLLCEHRDGSHRFVVQRKNHDTIAKVDPYRMKQLFGKVIENSLMAVPQGAELVVSVNSTHLEHAQAIEIEIKDNGKGLDPQTSIRLFEPFYTTKQHGIGLGLAICWRIVEAHNGRIHARNHPHGGTAVGIVIPKRD